MRSKMRTERMQYAKRLNENNTIENQDRVTLRKRGEVRGSEKMKKR